jgi:hypothetical protein
MPFWQNVMVNFFMSFIIPPPANSTNLFGNWLNRVPRKDKDYIRVGVCVLL